MISGLPIDFTYRLGRRLPASKQRIEETPQPSRMAYSVARHGRFWEVVDPDGTLVCLTAYKKGAVEVVRRLTEADASAAVGI